MSIFSRHRPSRRQSEQLLDGRRPATPAFDDLVGLLAAARGPNPADAELPGEQAVLAAFRTALSTTPGASVQTATSHPFEENKPVRTVALRRLLAVKVLAASVLTVGVGGVAMAATGMPLVPGGAGRSDTAAAHAAAPDLSQEQTGASRSGRGARTPIGSVTQKPAVGRRTTHEAQLVACWAYDAGRSTATPSPEKSGVPFADLVTAAGGADEVPAYCAGLVAEFCPVTGSDSGRVSPTADRGHLPGCPKHEPTIKASGPASDRASHPGSSHATPNARDGSPTEKHTGKPTTRPARGAPHSSPTQHPSETRREG